MVVKVLPEKKIGFIRSEDLNEDVFFHFSKVTKVGTLDLMEGDEVEYEVDELARIKKERLQATMVRRSIRPLAMRLKPSDAPELKAHHHPNARKRRPSWRGRNESSAD
ncbi:MAG: cold shock domain-containing protein [Planctomycetales bacterium]|nr:cold shock domain-containing protein [Planctomycetales bacterium]